MISVLAHLPSTCFFLHFSEHDLFFRACFDRSMVRVSVRNGARFFSFWRVKILIPAPKEKLSRTTFSRRETKKKTSINRLRKKDPSMLVFSMTMVYASSRGKASVCLQPVGTFADLGYQRNAQRGHHTLHTRANQLADFCSFGTEHVEVQFVMHLQDHTAL